MFKKENMKYLVVGLLGIAVAATGVSAYFTATKTVTNTFEVGSVDIEVQEPSWDPLNPPTGITPNQVIAKDPKIVNIGDNDAFVFAEVTIPTAEVAVVDENGDKLAAADTELFSYVLKDGWYQMGTYEEVTDDVTGKCIGHTYRYAYGTATAMTVVEDETGNLFDEVTFANVVEGQGLENQSLDMDVVGYAIQATDLDGHGATAKTAPADVWAIYTEQNQ